MPSPRLRQLWSSTNQSQDHSHPPRNAHLLMKRWSVSGFSGVSWLITAIRFPEGPRVSCRYPPQDPHATGYKISCWSYWDPRNDRRPAVRDVTQAIEWPENGEDIAVWPQASTDPHGSARHKGWSEQRTQRHSIHITQIPHWTMIYHDDSQDFVNEYIPPQVWWVSSH